MAVDDYIRCHYVSPEKVECGSWIQRSKAKDNLCPVHTGFVSTALASNGVNKEEYINSRKATELSLRETYIGKTKQEACQILDAHIAKIEAQIELLKIQFSVARALRSEQIDSMNEDEIKIRRQMTVQEKPAAAKKPGKLTSSMTDAEKIANMRAKFPGMSEKGAKSMLGLDDD